MNGLYANSRISSSAFVWPLSQPSPSTQRFQLNTLLLYTTHPPNQLLDLLIMCFLSLSLHSNSHSFRCACCVHLLDIVLSENSFVLFYSSFNWIETTKKQPTTESVSTIENIHPNVWTLYILALVLLSSSLLHSGTVPRNVIKIAEILCVNEIRGREILSGSRI